MRAPQLADQGEISLRLGWLDSCAAPFVPDDTIARPCMEHTGEHSFGHVHSSADSTLAISVANSSSKTCRRHLDENFQ
jgi:hypothetical protein